MFLRVVENTKSIQFVEEKKWKVWICLPRQKYTNTGNYSNLYVTCKLFNYI